MFHRKHGAAKHIGRATVLGAALLVAATAAEAGSLENLERERAILVSAILEPDLAPAERGEKIALAQRRLVDLERMVMRDDSLVGRNTPAVRRAFDNYNLTFLVHAATEGDMSVVDNWLSQVGITTQSLMATRRGRN